MIDVDALNDYLMWKRDKELYPPQWTPEDYIQHVLNLDSRRKLNMIAEVLSPESEFKDSELITIIKEVISNE